MKVLDLQCAMGHVFEGWFASETDFVDQCQRALVQCPVCGDPSVVKKLSAPRLSLSGMRGGPSEGPGEQQTDVVAMAKQGPSQAEAWLAMVRTVLAQTTNVGDQFAEEARKMHYGEKKAHAIRGTATLEETHALADEGIDVLSFPLPEASEGPLQ